MKIDRIYTITPVQKKRRIGCWLMGLVVILLFLVGFLTLNFILLPEKEADPKTLIYNSDSASPTSSIPWDGYFILNLSEDSPNGPIIFNSLMLMIANAAGVNLDGKNIQSLQQVILYPRIHLFMQSEPRSGDERLLVMLSLRRMSSMVSKLMNETLPGVPSIDNNSEPVDPDDPPAFQRLQLQNCTYISNHVSFLTALKDGQIIDAAAEPNENQTSFISMYEQLPAEGGILNGFVINHGGRLKELAGLLNDSGNDDIYYLVAEGIDLYYPAFWEESQWLRVQGKATQSDTIHWSVSIDMKNRLEAIRAERFFKDRYFPRLIEGLEAKIVNDIEVSRDEHIVTLQFSTTLNYLKYLIDSVQ